MSDEPVYVVGANPSKIVHTSPIPPEVQATANPNIHHRLRTDGQIDRRAFSSARNATNAGRKVEKLDAAKAIEATALVATGVPMGQALRLANLPESADYKIRKLVDISPAEFADRLADRMENILEKLTKRLEAETDDISTRDLTIQVAILTDKLSNLRGQKAPTSVHNTQIIINGQTREGALAMLTGKARPLQVVQEKAPTD